VMAGQQVLHLLQAYGVRSLPNHVSQTLEQLEAAVSQADSKITSLSFLCAVECLTAWLLQGGGGGDDPLACCCELYTFLAHLATANPTESSTFGSTADPALVSTLLPLLVCGGARLPAGVAGLQRAIALLSSEADVSSLGAFAAALRSHLAECPVDAVFAFPQCSPTTLALPKIELPSTFDWAGFRGYTVMLWLNIDPDTFTQRGEVVLYSVRNMSGQGVDSRVCTQASDAGAGSPAVHNLMVTSYGKDARSARSVTVRMDELAGVDGAWHLLTVSHTLPYVRKSVVKVTLDGVLRLQQDLTYPNITGGSSSSDSSMSRSVLCEGLVGELASAAFYEDEVPLSVIRTVLQAGPNHLAGALPVPVPRVTTELQSTLVKGRAAVEATEARLIWALLPSAVAHGSHVCCELKQVGHPHLHHSDIATPAKLAQRGANGGIRGVARLSNGAVAVMLYQQARSLTPSSSSSGTDATVGFCDVGIHDAWFRVGGVRALLYTVGCVIDRATASAAAADSAVAAGKERLSRRSSAAVEAQHAVSALLSELLSLLALLLEGHPSHREEMLQQHGYHMVATALQRLLLHSHSTRRCLDHKVLASCLNLLQAARYADTLSFSADSSAAVDIRSGGGELLGAALQGLLLDFRLWSGVATAVRVALLSGVAAAVCNDAGIAGGGAVVLHKYVGVQRLLDILRVHICTDITDSSSSGDSSAAEAAAAARHTCVTALVRMVSAMLSDSLLKKEALTAVSDVPVDDTAASAAAAHTLAAIANEEVVHDAAMMPVVPVTVNADLKAVVICLHESRSASLTRALLGMLLQLRLQQPQVLRQGLCLSGFVSCTAPALLATAGPKARSASLAQQQPSARRSVHAGDEQLDSSSDAVAVKRDCLALVLWVLHETKRCSQDHLLKAGDAYSTSKAANSSDNGHSTPSGRSSFTTGDAFDAADSSSGSATAARPHADSIGAPPPPQTPPYPVRDTSMSDLNLNSGVSPGGLSPPQNLQQQQQQQQQQQTVDYTHTNTSSGSATSSTDRHALIISVDAVYMHLALARSIALCVAQGGWAAAAATTRGTTAGVSTGAVANSDLVNVLLGEGDWPLLIATPSNTAATAAASDGSAVHRAADSSTITSVTMPVWLSLPFAAAVLPSQLISSDQRARVVTAINMTIKQDVRCRRHLLRLAAPLWMEALVDIALCDYDRHTVAAAAAAAQQSDAPSSSSSSSEWEGVHAFGEIAVTDNSSSSSGSGAAVGGGICEELALDALGFLIGEVMCAHDQGWRLWHALMPLLDSASRIACSSRSSSKQRVTATLAKLISMAMRRSLRGTAQWTALTLDGICKLLVLAEERLFTVDKPGSNNSNSNRDTAACAALDESEVQVHVDLEALAAFLQPDSSAAKLVCTLSMSQAVWSLLECVTEAGRVLRGILSETSAAAVTNSTGKHQHDDAATIALKAQAALRVLTVVLTRALSIADISVQQATHVSQELTQCTQAFATAPLPLVTGSAAKECVLLALLGLRSAIAVCGTAATTTSTATNTTAEKRALLEAVVMDIVHRLGGVSPTATATAVAAAPVKQTGRQSRGKHKNSAAASTETGTAAVSALLQPAADCDSVDGMFTALQSAFAQYESETHDDMDDIVHLPLFATASTNTTTAAATPTAGSGSNSSATVTDTSAAAAASTTTTLLCGTGQTGVHYAENWLSARLARHKERCERDRRRLGQSMARLDVAADLSLKAWVRMSRLAEVELQLGDTPTSSEHVSGDVSSSGKRLTGLYRRCEWKLGSGQYEGSEPGRLRVTRVPVISTECQPALQSVRDKAQAQSAALQANVSASAAAASAAKAGGSKKLSSEEIGMQLARKCSQYIVDITQKEARLVC
jgi:Domain of unknown function (DUF4704)